MPLLPPMLLFAYPLHNPTISSVSSSSWQQQKLQVDEGIEVFEVLLPSPPYIL